MSIIKIHIFSIIVASALLCVFVKGDSCLTPNDEPAECISIRQCHVILKAISTRDPVAIEFAKESQCGYDSQPLVCCGKTGNYTQLNFDLLPERSYCGLQHADDYIRTDDGIASNIDEFPWLAALFYETPEGIKNLCVGTLINSRYVLTTAHCLLTKPENAKLKWVRLGEFNLEQKEDCEYVRVGTMECNDPAIDIGVEKIIIHKRFNNLTLENAIGLIRLNETVSYTEYIRPICLPLPGYPRPKPGDTLYESGWGLLTKRKIQANIKKYIKVKLLSNEDCSSRLKFLIGAVLRERQMCTINISPNETAACSGDTGGPVMFTQKSQWFQEGAMAYGATCASGAPGLHMKVADYVYWIANNIRV